MIEPKYLKNNRDKVIGVYLDYRVYESIMDEIKKLSSKTKQSKKK